MGRRISRWAVTVCGVLLAGWGLGAMWTGWDLILLERGWSLFIGGAAALAGGVATAAIGQVVARLDELISLAAEAQAPKEPKAPAASAKKNGAKAWVPPPEPAPSATAAAAKPRAALEAKRPAAPVVEQRAEQKAQAPPNGAQQPGGLDLAARLARRIGEAPAGASVKATESRFGADAAGTTDDSGGELVEVDRYESGDTVYVMYSNGAVEVRGPQGTQRYTSLSELRAEGALRQL